VQRPGFEVREEQDGRLLDDQRGRTWLTWRGATERALYGDDGFYRRSGQPARHIRTSVHASVGYAAAMLRILIDVNGALRHPEQVDFVDVGADSGELAVQLGRIAPSEPRTRLRITCVDLAPRPTKLRGDIAWTATPADQISGLVIANEWLDNIAVDVVQQTADGLRLVLVNPESAAEVSANPPAPSTSHGCAGGGHWPLLAPGQKSAAHETRRGAPCYSGCTPAWWSPSTTRIECRPDPGTARSPDTGTAG
jgi:hypothetical protein